MKVLLISPLPGIDPACGDVTYTQSLLARPPVGVEYETYSDAINRGTLVELGKRSRFWLEPFLTATAKGINVLRKWRWLFWEPFRFFQVKPGEYDLIHVHVFSARFKNPTCPIVVSNAAPLRYLYTEARRYSRLRTRAIEAVEICAARAMGINHMSYYLPQATRVIAFTEFLKQWYVSQDIVPEGRIDVVPISIPGRESALLSRMPRTIGFIAKDFAAKGGPTLLEAFRRVRTIRPDAQLVIVGCPPHMSDEQAARDGIAWLPYVARDRLLNEILPTFDVFAYPTRIDGQPLVVIEALAAGVPVIVSDYQAMPEMVEHGRAGLISPIGSAEKLAENILRLLDPTANQHYRQAAHDWFESTFSEAAVRPQLLRCYERAIESFQSPKAIAGTAAMEAVA